LPPQPPLPGVKAILFQFLWELSLNGIIIADCYAVAAVAEKKRKEKKKK